MKNIFYLFLFVFGSVCYSQSFIEDQYVYGGSFGTEPIKILQANGNIYILLTNASVPLSGNLTAEDIGGGGLEALVICMNQNGQSLWQKMYGGTSGDVPLDMIDVGDGLVMAISSSSAPGTGNKTSELFTDEQFASSDYWIVKINYNGDIVWQKTYGSYEQDRPSSLMLTDSGNILVTGYCAFSAASTSELTGNKTVPNKGRTDIWAILLDEQGNDIWQQTYGVETPNQSYVGINNAALLPNGDMLILGKCAFPGISGDKTEESLGYNGWLLCVDPNGNKLWDRIYGGFGAENAGSVIVDGQDVFLIFESSTDLTGNKTVPRKGVRDIWVIKTDFEGNIIAQTSFGDSGENLFYGAYLHENRIIISTLGDSELPSIDKSEPSRGGLDMWIVSFDKGTLELVNEKTYGGSESERTKSVVYFENHIFAVGWSSSNVSGDKTLPNYGEANAWILKLNPTHLLQTSEQQISKPSLYPVPSNGVLNISFLDYFELKSASLSDVSGKVVQEKIFSGENQKSISIDVKDLIPGVYILHLESIKSSVKMQVVIE
jgi:hypothetical protein